MSMVRIDDFFLSVRLLPFPLMSSLSSNVTMLPADMFLPVDLLDLPSPFPDFFSCPNRPMEVLWRRDFLELTE